MAHAGRKGGGGCEAFATQGARPAEKASVISSVRAS